MAQPPIIAMREPLFTIVSSVGAIAFLAIMFVAGEAPRDAHRIASVEAGLIAEVAGRITAIKVRFDGKETSFVSNNEQWLRADDQKPVTRQIAANIDTGIELLRKASPVRIIRPEAVALVDHKAYGFGDHALTITLTTMKNDSIIIQFGTATADELTRYAHIAGRGEIFVTSGFLFDAWQSLVTESGATVNK